MTIADKGSYDEASILVDAGSLIVQNRLHQPRLVLEKTFLCLKKRPLLVRFPSTILTEGKHIHPRQPSNWGGRSLLSEPPWRFFCLSRKSISRR